MDNTQWDSLVIEVNEYLEADQTLDAGLRQVVEYNHDPIIASITMKHIKSGGGAFENAEDYASAVLKRTRNNLGKMFKNDLWDGSVDSLLGESSEEL